MENMGCCCSSVWMREEHVENEWGSPPLLFSSQLQKGGDYTEKCCYVQHCAAIFWDACESFDGSDIFCWSLFPFSSKKKLFNADGGWWQGVIFQSKLMWVENWKQKGNRFNNQPVVIQLRSPRIGDSPRLRSLAVALETKALPMTLTAVWGAQMETWDRSICMYMQVIKLHAARWWCDI